MQVEVELKLGGIEKDRSLASIQKDITSLLCDDFTIDYCCVDGAACEAEDVTSISAT